MRGQELPKVGTPLEPVQGASPDPLDRTALNEVDPIDIGQPPGLVKVIQVQKFVANSREELRM